MNTQPLEPDNASIEMTGPPGTAPYAVAYLLGILGVALIVWAFTYDVSAGSYGYEGGVANLDKMERRMMLLHSGLASMMGCLLSVGFAQVVKAIRSMR